MILSRKSFEISEKLTNSLGGWVPQKSFLILFQRSRFDRSEKIYSKCWVQLHWKNLFQSLFKQ